MFSSLTNSSSSFSHCLLVALSNGKQQQHDTSLNKMVVKL